MIVLRRCSKTSAALKRGKSDRGELVLRGWQIHRKSRSETRSQEILDEHVFKA